MKHKLHLLLFTSMMILAGMLNQPLNAQIIDAVNIPTSSLSCTNTTITVNATQLCINYVYQGGNQSVVADTLYLNLSWQVPGPICLGAISFIQEDFTFSTLPAGVNTVIVTTFLDGIPQNTATNSINVTSCCPAIPSFTANSTINCILDQDTFQFTNTSTGSTGQSWYVDNILQSSSVDFSYYQASAGFTTIKLVVTDGTCSDSTDLLVGVLSNPVVDLGADVQGCEGETKQLSVTPGYSNYDWSGFANNSPSITVNNTGTYWVEVTDNNGCINSDTVEVDFSPLPMVELGSDTSLCSGQSVDLDAGMYTSYNWSNNATSQVITVNTANTYSVLVTDSFGCENEDTIVINAAPTPIVDLGSDTVGICDGDTAALDAGSHVNYVWSNGENTQMILASSKDLYTVTVTNSSNCEASDSVYVDVYDLPIIAWSAATSICNDSSLTLDAGSFSSYSWSNGSITQSITIDSSSLSAGDNSFSLTVVDSNGCSTMAAIIVTLLDCDTIVQPGIKENTLDPNLSFYPNPSKGLVNIEFSSLKQDIELSVLNLAGSIQFEANYENTSLIQVDLENFSNGIYIIQLKSKDKQAFLKLIKK